MSLEDTSINVKLGFEHLVILGALIVFAAGFSLGYSVRGRNTSESSRGSQEAETVLSEKATSPAEGTPTVQPQVQQSFPRSVSEGGNPAIGPQDAPVTIIEFGDYECPFCTQFFNQTLPQILEAYGGQIRFVYRDFPLMSIQPQAIPAAEAANCAGEQDRYWDYHDKLYSGGPLTLGNRAYIDYAEELGLDVASFADCLETDRTLKEVQADLDYARSLGLRSTPSFFVTGQWVIGVQPFEVFQQIIESELSESSR